MSEMIDRLADVIFDLGHGTQKEARVIATAVLQAMKTVWIYTDTSKDVGDPDHLKVFATEDDAIAWFKDNDPEGVAFAYPIIEKEPDAG